MARRILDSEKRHRSWEASHFRLMKSVAAMPSTEGQLRRLRELASSLTNATRLYEKAGMQVTEKYNTYELELRPGQDLMMT